MKHLARRIPLLQEFLETDGWRSVRHRVALLLDRRTNSHFTGFYRLPTQFESLMGPVLTFLKPENLGRPLKITVVGCSNGAEAYSVASVLSRRDTAVEFRILAFDINQDIIEKARAGAYLGMQEVLNNKTIAKDFIDATFDIQGESYLVKHEIKSKVSFSLGDILDTRIAEANGESDIVFAQNFLFHLSPAAASRAFDNICALLAGKAALFVDGMDLPLRQNVTKKHGLAPLDYKIGEIHNEARWARAVGWPYHYWGLEPLSMTRQDWRQRYATIFLKGL